MRLGPFYASQFLNGDKTNLNDYLILHINKRFLKLSALIVALIVSHVVTAKVAYKKGGTDFYNYLMQSLSKPSSSDSGASERSDEKTHRGSSIRF